MLLRQPLLDFGINSEEIKRRKFRRHNHVDEWDSSPRVEGRVRGESLFKGKAVKLKPLVGASQLYEKQEKVSIFEANQPVQQLANLRELPQILDARQPGSSTPMWIDIEADAGSLSNVMLVLQVIFNLHPATARDVTCGKSLDKFELFQNVESIPDYLLLLIYCPDERTGSDEFLSMLPLSIIVMRGILITVRTSPMAAIQTVAQQFQQGTLASEGHIVASLAMEIVALFEKLMDVVTEEVDAMEDITLLLSRKELLPMLNRMSVVRKRLASLLKALLPKQEVFGKLVTCSTFMSRSALLYLHEPLDHVELLVKQGIVSREVLHASLNSYSLRMTMQVSEASDRITKVMQRLTIISLVLLPLSLIAGLFGMNVSVPGQNDVITTLQWFFGIIGIMVGIVLIMMIAFKKIGWLDIGNV